MNLTQKETALLKDLKDQEKLCIDKYNKHSSCAKDAQLKELFASLAKVEQGHLNSLDQVSNGTVPTPASSASTNKTFTAAYSTANTPDKQNDCYLCTDLLAGEKHVSHLYDTCVFEFSDENCRNLLNHIQKEEQEHGKLIYDYMKTNSMYS